MRFILITLFCVLGGFVIAQKPYFQQEVNYTIKVTLDDRAHTLNGDISMEYVNHSPDALSEIWIHLWPNAFKNRRSAFCRQKLRTGSTQFYFAADTALGYIKGLDFTLDGVKAVWKIDPVNPDIAVITLPRPLASGAKTVIATPFIEKIPASFSRLGHVGTSYQMTQWYPKPAVYDREGWHAMPYLDMGEFYSEFGRFDVSVTLPQNYVVGATGALQNVSEIEFLAKKEAETRAEMARRGAATETKKKGQKAEFPPSAAETKTLRWLAENVHDFAWFADKRFYVLKDTARLASGRTVDCWAMFTAEDFDLWQKGAFYVRRAVEFYSGHVGEYPWPHATAVHSALSAGGGMEYPMITVIGDSEKGQDLDDVITHEVGHNWFYGLLASNERDHPWMDEGMNTYYEHRYMRQYYGPKAVFDEMLPKKIYQSENHGSALNNAVVLLARNGYDMPADTNSDVLSSAAYGIHSYMKTSVALRWLENAVGVEKFDRAMQDYFRRWSFKHPRPVDFAASLRESGVQPEWLMRQMQTRQLYNPALVKVKKQSDGKWTVRLRQKGQHNGPVPVSAIKDGHTVATEWYSPQSRTQTVEFPAVEADRFEIDADQLTPDLNRHNNTYRPGALFKRCEKPRIRLFAPVEHKNRPTLGVLPWAGFNNYDKMTAGLLIYNPPMPGQAFQYYLAPGWAFNTGELVGGGDLRWRIHPRSGRMSRLTIGLNGRSFHDNYLGADVKYYTRFRRLTPWVQANLRGANPSQKHIIKLESHFIGQEIGIPDTIAGTPDDLEWVNSRIPRLTYQWINRGMPNPARLAVSVEGQTWENDLSGLNENYVRLAATWDQNYYYAPKKKVSLRLFAGGFVNNTEADRKFVGFGASDGATRGALSLAAGGYTDYSYQQIYLDRNGQSGLLSRQAQPGEGGFKYAFGSAFASSGDVGHSNQFLIALNLKSDLPQKLPLNLPLRPWFDLGYAKQAHLPEGGDRTWKDDLFWSGGFALELFGGHFNVYFPVYSSAQLQRQYKQSGKYWNWITWSLRLDDLNPGDLVDGLMK